MRLMIRPILSTIVGLFISCSLQAQDSSEVAKWYKQGKKQQGIEQYMAAAKSFVKAIAHCPDDLDPDTEKGNQCINCHFNIGICAFELKKYKAAEKAFTNVLMSNTMDHEAFARRGQARMELGKEKAAMADLEEAMRIIIKDWNNTDDYYRIWYTHDLAIALRDLKRYEEAIKYLNTAIELDDNPEYRMERAEMLYRLGRLDELEKDLDVLEEKGGIGPNLNFERGLVFMNNSMYKEAIPYFSKVEDKDEVVLAVRNLALCHIQLNELISARGYISDLEEIKHKPAEIAWMKSQIFAKEGNWAKAIDQSNLAESLLEDNDPLFEYLTYQRADIHYRKGEFRDAIGEAGSIASPHLLYVGASSLKALAHLESGEKKDAGDILIEEQGKHPNNPLIQGRIAWFLFRTGLKEEAANKLSNLAILYPFSPEINYYCAEANYQLERISHEEAHLLLDKALDIDPSLEEAYILKARLFYEQGRIGESMRFLEMGEKLGITHTYSSFNAAAIYLAENKAEKALSKSSISILRAPDEPEFQRQHGIAFFNTGDWSDAILFLEKAIAQNPNDAEAIKARGLAYMMSGQAELGNSDFNSLSNLELMADRNLDNRIVKKQARPDFATAYIYYSRLFSHDLSNEENYHNALAMLEKALYEAGQSSTKNLGMVYNEIGLLKWAKGDKNAALRSFDNGIELDPNATLYKNRSSLHYQLGNTVESASDLEKSKLFRN